MTGPRVLIAYATKYGTTKEIAEEIQDVLAENGIESDLTNVMETGIIDSYDAVILGSPVYMGKMLVEAREFCQHYRPYLKNIWLAIFVDGISCCNPGETNTSPLIAAIRDMHEYVRPVMEMGFSGAFSPVNLSEADAQIADMVHPPVGDFRDHEAIRIWAREIVSAISKHREIY
ncbi:flavodoxin domain-containing protein [Methanogenium marinum]|uniref:Flavodoxin domain-containing protein n=1 Tax=Methanogenium marinum TaxID=348610 RepID=A0A9Q4KR27_9EURY|nr:flavodoxin domain-containing protein [Methanogenium marinum]MDE4908958.1 flavodoxin domain-containing protein [Methanogenium marinum]